MDTEAGVPLEKRAIYVRIGGSRAALRLRRPLRAAPAGAGGGPHGGPVPPPTHPRRAAAAAAALPPGAGRFPHGAGTAARHACVRAGTPEENAEQPAWKSIAGGGVGGEA